MRVGITGHQELGEEKTASWVSVSIHRALKKDNGTIGYSCLAIGADSIFVEVLLEIGLPFDAIIPCASYEQTFKSKDNVDRYFRLLKKASKIIWLPFNEPSEEAYMAGGKKVVDCCDILYAVWNGNPSKGLGGTADVVNYAKTNKKSVFHINPLTQAILSL